MVSLPIIKCKLCGFLYDKDGHVVNPHTELSFKNEEKRWGYGGFHTGRFYSIVEAQDIAELDVCEECKQEN